MYFWCLKRNEVSNTFTFAYCHHGDGSRSEGEKNRHNKFPIKN